VEAASEAYFNAAYLLDPYLTGGPQDSDIDFMTRRRYGVQDVPYVSRDGYARSERDKAIGHLRLALGDEYDSAAAFSKLSLVLTMEGDFDALQDLADQRVEDAPLDARAWMVRGMSAVAGKQEREAQRSFERALALMTEAEAELIRSTGTLLLQDHVFAPESGDLWESLDPRLLTDENERKLEHFARLTYSDLRFGDESSGTRGWDTDPGGVIVRYGVPLAEAQNTTRFDRYFVFHYGDLWFKFMDLAKAGRPTFYSPKLAPVQASFDAVEDARDDFDLISREAFRQVPQRFVYDRGGTRVAFPALASAFRGRNGETDLFVAYGVPREPGSDQRVTETGVFILTHRGRVGEYRSTGPRGFDVQGSRQSLEVFGGSVPVAPGEYTISVEFEMNQGSRVGFQRIPGHARNMIGFTVGDLVLAYLVEEGTGATQTGDFNLERGGFSLRAAPWGVFERGEPIYVYFELYGLTVGRDGKYGYELEAVLADEPPEEGEFSLSAIFRRSEYAVSVRYSVTARGESDQQYVILDTSGAKEGTYLVALRLTDGATGATATSHRAVVITSRE
jgi:GWxTD domain-containing protein